MFVLRKTCHACQAWQTTKKNLDIEQIHLRIYFPKLRKIKPLPLKGSGKHKYSFQRVEVPPLPVHFCDCEEHFVPLKLAEKKFGIDLDTETCGVNEEELSMVKSVLNKFLERENCGKSVSDVIDFAEKTYTPISSVDNVHVCGYEDDRVIDEDGLVINVISHPRNGVSLVKDRVQEHGLHGSKKSMHASDRKRKASVSMDDAHVLSPNKRKMRKQVPQYHIGDLRNDVSHVTTRAAETESGTTTHLTDGVAFSKKSACRDLVNQKGSATFHISDVLTNHNPEVASSTSKKEMCDNGSSTDKESEKVPDIQPIKLIDAEDKKSSRGAHSLKNHHGYNWLGTRLTARSILHKFYLTWQLQKNKNLNNYMEMMFRVQQTKTSKTQPPRIEIILLEIMANLEKKSTAIPSSRIWML